MKNKIRVLMVDDNEEFTSEVVQQFSGSNLGIEILGTCSNGEDALRELRNNYVKYDLVIMDLVLPNRDGLSVLDEINKSNIPIKSIVTTSLNRLEIINKCLDLGVSYYMLKPYNCDSLANIIKDIFSNKVLPMVNNKDLQQAITNLLHSLGMPSHIKGYSYIRDGITMLYDNPSMLGAITKELYPDIALRYDTTSSRVERAIRHAIEVSWVRGDYEVMEEVFGHSVDYDRAKPTNSEFMATLAD